MNKQTSLKQPILSIDIKRNLIRIHKITLELLGYPDYIQLLINPSSQSIAICKGNANDHLAHPVKYEYLVNGQSYELYSQVLIQALQGITELCPKNCTYRIYGNYNSNMDIVQFRLDNTEQVKEVIRH